MNLKLRDVFFDRKPLDEKDYEFSRRMSIFEGCTARAVFNLTSGAFLAGYANFLGADDAFNGIIGAIPVLAGIMSIFSPLYFEKRDKRKLQVVVLNFLHRFVLGLMGFIPLAVSGRTSRLVLLAILYLAAYMSFSFSNPAGSAILIGLAPEHIRGRYFSKRESILLAAGIVFTLVLGRVLDVYKNAGNEYGGFIVNFSVVLALAFANAFFWSKIKEPPVRTSKRKFSIRQIMLLPLKNAAFKKIIIFFVIYNIGLQVGGPFFSVYMVTGLKLDYTYITVMGMISTVVNVILVRVWGRIADSKSWKFVLAHSVLLLGIVHFCWIFVNSYTAYMLVPILHIVSGSAWAGIGISTFNIQYIYCPENGRTIYTGFNAALGGLMGFIGTSAGSALLGFFGNLGLRISNFSISGMQVLFCLSGLLLATCAAYAHFFIKIKQPASQ